MRNSSFSKNNRFFKPSIILPIMLILMTFLDGSNTNLLASFMPTPRFHLLSNLTLILIFYIIRFKLTDEFYFWVWIGITGFLYDLNYTLNFGTYIISFLLSAYVMYYLNSIMSTTTLSSISIFSAGFITFYLFVLISGIITSSVNISGSDYLLFTIIPTYLINALMMYILYRPSSWASYSLL